MVGSVRFPAYLLYAYYYMPTRALGGSLIGVVL